MQSLPILELFAPWFLSVRFDCKSGSGHGKMRHYSCFDTDESKGSPCVHKFLTTAAMMRKFRIVVHFSFEAHIL
jgi:hypothetical protein